MCGDPLSRPELSHHFFLRVDKSDSEKKVLVDYFSLRQQITRTDVEVPYTFDIVRACTKSFPYNE